MENHTRPFLFLRTNSKRSADLLFRSADFISLGTNRGPKEKVRATHFCLSICRRDGWWGTLMWKRRALSLSHREAAKWRGKLAATISN